MFDPKHPVWLFGINPKQYTEEGQVELQKYYDLMVVIMGKLTPEERRLLDAGIDCRPHETMDIISSFCNYAPDMKLLMEFI